MSDLFQIEQMMQRLSGLVEKERQQFSDEFVEWLPKNLHVWEAFVNETFAVLDVGFKKYSARTIIHVIRHHSAIRENGTEWKVSNNSSPYLARLFALVYPEHASLFKYKATPRAEGDNVHRKFNKDFFE